MKGLGKRVIGVAAKSNSTDAHRPDYFASVVAIKPIIVSAVIVTIHTAANRALVVGTNVRKALL